MEKKDCDGLGGTVGQEEAMQAVRNLCPWARASLTRIGTFRGRLIGVLWPKSGSKSCNKLWSHHFCVTYCVFIPREKA